MIKLTSAAIYEIKKQREDTGAMLRILAKSGGCSGAVWEFEFDLKKGLQDSTKEFDGLIVVMDTETREAIGESAVLDWSWATGFNLEGAGNGRSCGCGRSWTP